MIKPPSAVAPEIARVEPDLQANPAEGKRALRACQEPTKGILTNAAAFGRSDGRFALSGVIAHRSIEHGAE